MNSKPRIILLFITIAVINSQLAIYLYLSGLPAISKQLHISDGASQLSLSLFFIAFGVSQLFYGTLSESIGRKKTYYVGLLILLIGCLFAVIVNSSFGFITARVLQGFGAGVSSVLARAIIRDSFTGDKSVSGMSIMISATALTPAFAICIGGFIIPWIGWRSCFAIIGSITLLLVIAIHYFLPDIKQKTTAFNPREIYKHYQYILSNKAFLLHVILVILSFSCMVSYLAISPFVLQKGFSLTSESFGLIMLIPTISYMLSTMIGRQICKRYRSRYAIFAGAFCVIVSGLCLFVLSHFNAMSASWFVIFITINTLGIGFIFAIINSIALQNVTHSIGVAAATLGALQNAGGGFVSSMITHFHLTSADGLGIVLMVLGITITILSTFIIWNKPINND